jgi:hypothetical protein
MEFSPGQGNIGARRRELLFCKFTMPVPFLSDNLNPVHHVFGLVENCDDHQIIANRQLAKMVSLKKELTARVLAGLVAQRRSASAGNDIINAAAI